MNCTTSELFGAELTDPDLAVKRYNRNVIGRIREVFDEAEAPAPVPPTCSKCGAVLEETARFCGRCGMPLSAGAAGELLADLLAENVGTTADNPNFQEALARLREEMPEEWAALVQKIGAPATA